MTNTIAAWKLHPDKRVWLSQAHSRHDSASIARHTLAATASRRPTRTSVRAAVASPHAHDAFREVDALRESVASSARVLMAVAFGCRSRRRPRLVTDVLAPLRSLYRAPRVYLSSNSAATTSRGEDFTFQQSTARGIVLSENSNAFHYQFHWH